MIIMNNIIASFEAVKCCSCEKFHKRQTLTVCELVPRDGSVTYSHERLLVKGCCRVCAPTLAAVVARDMKMQSFAWQYGAEGWTAVRQ